MKIDIGDKVEFEFAGSKIEATVKSFYKRGNDKMAIATCERGYRHPIEINQLKKLN